MASLLKRGKVYYVQFYLNGKPKRRSLGTANYQLAKAKLAKLDAAMVEGEDSPLPTRTPIPDVLERYARHVRSYKTDKGAQNELYVLRGIFGPCCEALQNNGRTAEVRGKNRKGRGRRRKSKTAKGQYIEASCFEQITTQQVAEFLSSLVLDRGLAHKTANHHRQILTRVFNWAMEEGGVKMPGDRNPAARTRRFKEDPPQISFLTLDQIDEQLEALAAWPQMQTMAALYIYAGLRREEALWLQPDDVDLNAGANGMIRVRAKTVGGRSWRPKTKVNRAVPISTALRGYLENYQPPASDHDWFFPSPEGVWWDPDNFSRSFKAICKKTGLAWTCLDFRHTFGSQLAMKGESLYKISTLMGNSPEICRRHYAALIPEALADTVEFPTKEPRPPAAHLKLVTPESATA